VTAVGVAEVSETFAGQIMVGACASLTVTVKLQLPPPKLLVQLTVVTPFWKVEPEAGVQVTVPHVPLVVGAG
jgi:hypothetical protein